MLIKNTQIPVKVFFIIFEPSLKSIPPEIEPTKEKQRHILIIGTSAITMKFSTIDKNSIMDAFDTAALEIEPVIMYIALITGAKVFIVSQRVAM
jgi:hypothetical protein